MNLTRKYRFAGYICGGGVGRGKTWLMDLFYHSLPGERKLRLHFHRFMLRVHEETYCATGGRVIRWTLLPTDLKPRRTYCVSMSFRL
ncbi:ATP/GTP-binding protein [Salmonella bongori]|nr:ATP/GTP-binding protein [Salmonella bongori]